MPRSAGRTGRPRATRSRGWARGREQIVLLTAALVLLVIGTASGAGAATGAPAGGTSPTSARNTAPPRITHDVNYGQAGDPGNLLDIYQPADRGGEPHPIVVLVHGGGWTSGDKSAVAPDAVAFAQAGFVAFSIAYDLEEVSKWPDELDDTLTAIRWAQDHAASYGADPSRLGLVGSSAGGNLVMLAATRGLGEGRAPIRAVVSWSGPSDLTDLAPTGESDAALTHPSVLPIPGETTPPGCLGDVACIGLIGPEYIQAYMGCSLTECPDRYRAASPVFQVTASTPPMYLAAATEDLIPEEQAYEMVDALTAAGVTSRLQVIPGEGHAESYRPVALPPTIDFLTTFVANGANAQVPTDATPTTIAGSAALPPLVNGNQLPTPAGIAAGPATSAPASKSPGPGESQLPHLDLIAIVVVLAVIGLFLLVRSRRAPLDDDYDDHAHDQPRDPGPDRPDGADALDEPDPGDPSAG